MNKIPTAEAPIYFLQSYIEKLVDSSCKEIPYEGTEVDKSTLRTNILELVLQQRREYAKLQVKAALKAAANNVKMSVEPYDMEAWEIVPAIIKAEDLEEHEDGFEVQVDKDSILNAYPENLIV